MNIEGGNSFIGYVYELNKSYLYLIMWQTAKAGCQMTNFSNIFANVSRHIFVLINIQCFLKQQHECGFHEKHSN
jgi:hypothetical protein